MTSEVMAKDVVWRLGQVWYNHKPGLWIKALPFVVVIYMPFEKQLNIFLRLGRD